MKYLLGLGVVALTALSLTLSGSALYSVETLPKPEVSQSELDEVQASVEGETSLPTLCLDYLRPIGENQGIKTISAKVGKVKVMDNKATVAVQLNTSAGSFKLTCEMQRSNWTVTTAR